MTAKFDLPNAPMPEIVHTSTTELMDLENVGVSLEFFRYLVWKLIYCVNSYLLPAMAAIFDWQFTPISGSGPINSNVLLDPTHVGVGFASVMPSGMYAEILRCFICTSGNGDHLDSPLTPISVTIELPVILLILLNWMGITEIINL